MYWERVFIREADTWSNGGTYKITLPATGLLSSIAIHARRAGVTDAFNLLEKWRLIDYISKVEVLGNGATPIKSFSGEVAKALTWHDGGGGAPDQEFNYGSSTKRAHFMINFGRKLFDRKYALDLSRFDSVELNLTNTGTSTLFGGDWTVDVIGYYLRQGAGPAPQGFFRTEEWRSWTTVADETKYLDLPTELKIRRILMHVLAGVGATENASDTPYNVADRIKLWLKSRQTKVMDWTLREIWYENYFHDGRQPLALIEPYHTGGQGVKTGLGQSIGKAIGQMPQGGTPGASTIALEPGNDGQTQKLLRTGSDNYSMILAGLGLENSALIPFDQDPDDPTTWLDPAADKTVNLDIHTKNAAASAGGTIKVILDRLVTV